MKKKYITQTNSASSNCLPTQPLITSLCPGPGLGNHHFHRCERMDYIRHGHVRRPYKHFMIN